jgi:hypothetical protein
MPQCGAPATQDLEEEELNGRYEARLCLYQSANSNVTATIRRVKYLLRCETSAQAALT